MTLLNTTTTQKVACPTTIVSRPGSRPTALNAVRSARPVMIPGRAIGSSSSSDTAFLPKKALRHRAPAASVPSTKAMAVDRAAILSDSVTACRMSLRPAASLNQRSVSPCGGKLKAASSVLKA